MRLDGRLNPILVIIINTNGLDTSTVIWLSGWI
jgi:hypothetical protein